MMTDSSIAEKRRDLGYPSESSRSREIIQVFYDLLKHESLIQLLGPRKGFFSVVERRRLYDVLERYGLPIDDPDALIAEVKKLMRQTADTSSR
jgi:hypothetical protein